MKLKCNRHHRRALVIPSQKFITVIHREDGSACDSPSLVLGDQVYQPWEVELRGASVDLSRKIYGSTDTIRDSEHAARGEGKKRKRGKDHRGYNY